MKNIKPNKVPVIIGGIVLDLRGQPKEDLQLYTSNPGSLQQTPGGVCRNICENLSRLGFNPLLISTIGGDPQGRWLLDHCKSLNLSTEGILTLPDKRTAIYLAILDAKGDLHTAIADMDIFVELKAEQILSFKEQLIHAPMVIIDTNLPLETIKTLCQFCHQNKIPIWVEPVSVEKSKKLFGLMDRITYLSPNRDELSALTKMEIHTDKEFSKAIKILLDQGIHHLLVTLGKDGIVLANSEGIHHIPAFPAKVVDVTGAGDAFVAGTIFALLEGVPIKKAVHYGLISAKMTIETAETVSHLLSQDRIKEYFSEVD